VIKFSVSNIKTVVNTAGVWTKKHSPELLLVGGTVTLVGAIVTAAKAGSETPEIIYDHTDRLRDAKIAYARDKEVNKTDIVKVYGKTALNMAKSYAPSIALTALSITCYFSAYGIIKKRYTALSAAYVALDNSFKLYRQRVIEDRGEEADRYYLTGEKPANMTLTDENGEKTKLKAISGNGEIASPYAFKFGKYKASGEKNNRWQNNDILNRAFLCGQQDYLTDALYLRCVFDDDHNVIKRGSVMLNEIRELCGEDPCSTGAVVGNRFSNGEPGCNGFIDFNIVDGIEKDPETGRDIPFYIINPNVDGLIYDLLDQFEEKPFQPKTNKFTKDEVE